MENDKDQQCLSSKTKKNLKSFEFAENTPPKKGKVTNVINDKHQTFNVLTDRINNLNIGKPLSPSSKPSLYSKEFFGTSNNKESIVDDGG